MHDFTEQHNPAWSRFLETIKSEDGWAKGRIRVPMSIISDDRRGVTDAVKTLCMHYARYPNGSDLSDKRLARALGVPERVIRLWRKRAEGAGHLDPKPRGRKKTRLVKIRDRTGIYSFVPIPFLEANISHAARTLLAAIAYAQSDNKITWRPISYLAQLARINEKYAARLKKELQKQGLIEVGEPALGNLADITAAYAVLSKSDLKNVIRLCVPVAKSEYAASVEKRNLTHLKVARSGSVPTDQKAKLKPIAYDRIGQLRKKDSPLSDSPRNPTHLAVPLKAKSDAAEDGRSDRNAHELRGVAGPELAGPSTVGYQSSREEVETEFRAPTLSQLVKAYPFPAIEYTHNQKVEAIQAHAAAVADGITSDEILAGVRRFAISWPERCPMPLGPFLQKGYWRREWTSSAAAA